MTDIADKTAFREYDVNAVYYLVVRRPLGEVKGLREQRHSYVYSTWKCVEKNVNVFSGCQRDEYKFVLVAGIAREAYVKDCVVYTSGRDKDLIFYSFDEFVELVMIDKRRRDSNK